jgi:hypothetical protein
VPDPCRSLRVCGEEEEATAKTGALSDRVHDPRSECFTPGTERSCNYRWKGKSVIQIGTSPSETTIAVVTIEIDLGVVVEAAAETGPMTAMALLFVVEVVEVRRVAFRIAGGLAQLDQAVLFMQGEDEAADLHETPNLHSLSLKFSQLKRISGA